MVRRKYKIRLTVLAILLVLSLTVEFDYQLWKIDNRQTDLAITESGCVEIIYSDDKSFNLVNPEATKDSDGPRTIPKTISISNNCSDIKTINVTMDVLNTSSIESNKVKVYINGDENQEPTLLSELKELKNSDEEIKEKRLLYKYDIGPNSTTRLNIRMWLDEEYAITSDKNSFNTNYYVTAQEQVIKPTIVEKILSDNQVLSNIDYNDLSTSGLYKIDNSYYFRGNVSNNYMSFANKVFRIVGINSDRSLKLVYVNNELKSSYNDNNYAESNLAYEDSKMEEYLNTWYQDNLLDYDSYIVSYNYCNDTSSTSFYSRTDFGSSTRVFNDNIPSIECPSSNKEYGGLYSGKIGLLSLDEVSIAGGSKNIVNTSFYLYNGESYYTMSPTKYYYGAYMGIMDSTGKLGEVMVTNERSVLPVININGSLNLAGSGTLEDPYVLDLED